MGQRAGAAQSWDSPSPRARQGCRPQAAQRPHDYESRVWRKHGPSGQTKQRPVTPPSREHRGSCRGPRWAPSAGPPQIAHVSFNPVTGATRAGGRASVPRAGPVLQPVVTALHPACLPPPPVVAAFRALSQACSTVCVWGCICVCACVCISVCPCAHVCVCGCVCLCVYGRTYVYVVCAHVSVCICVHV